MLTLFDRSRLTGTRDPRVQRPMTGPSHSLSVSITSKALENVNSTYASQQGSGDRMLGRNKCELVESRAHIPGFRTLQLSEFGRQSRTFSTG